MWWSSQTSRDSHSDYSGSSSDRDVSRNRPQPSRPKHRRSSRFRSPPPSSWFSRFFAAAPKDRSPRRSTRQRRKRTIKPRRGFWTPSSSQGWGLVSSSSCFVSFQFKLPTSFPFRLLIETSDRQLTFHCLFMLFLYVFTILALTISASCYISH